MKERQSASHDDEWTATRVVLTSSLVALLLSFCASMYVSFSSSSLSSEQVTYAAWYSKVADRIRALLAETWVPSASSFFKLEQTHSTLYKFAGMAFKAAQ